VACSAAGLAQVRFGPPPAQVRAVSAVTGMRARHRETPRPHPRAAADAVPPEETHGEPSGAREEPGAREDPAALEEPGGACGQLERACGQLGEYFAGQRRVFDLPVDWSGMSASQCQVLPVLLASAGYGETVTYGALARRAGLADGGKVPAARVTGQIMGSNPCPIVVPCHRVVAAGGRNGGFSAPGGVDTKLRMLAIEGAALF